MKPTTTKTNNESVDKPRELSKEEADRLKKKTIKKTNQNNVVLK
jgi:hypothetical protein